jgi:hypothetical protein
MTATLQRYGRIMRLPLASMRLIVRPRWALCTGNNDQLLIVLEINKGENRMQKGSATILLLVLFCLGSAGCQAAQFTKLGPQTHFDFPNSNVIPLGPVKAKVDGPGSVFAFPGFSSDYEAQLYNAAISQVAGANMITDYIRTYKVYTLLLLPVYWTTLEIEGTAAKMEVGKQILK